MFIYRHCMEIYYFLTFLFFIFCQEVTFKIGDFNTELRQNDSIFKEFKVTQ
jgi:hypothetical protein